MGDVGRYREIDGLERLVAHRGQEIALLDPWLGLGLGLGLGLIGTLTLALALALALALSLALALTLVGRPREI